MSVAPTAAVVLRSAEPADCRQVWLWRNDAATRRASFDPAPIPYEGHERWFRESLASPRRKIYIVVAGGRACGVARLDLDGLAASVSIHLAPASRGRGVGPAALDALADLAFGGLGLHRLDATVRPENRASLSAFARAGFVPSPAGSVIALTRRSRAVS